MKIESRKWRAAFASAALLSALALVPYLSAQADEPIARTAAVTDTATAGKPVKNARVAEATLERDTGISPAAACEAGSLRDCEELYCSAGLSEECRTRVLQTAKISTDTWYLRERAQVKADGSTVYAIRCMTEPAIRDLTVMCSAAAGPNRCSTAPKSNSGYARFDKAATGYCSTN